MKLSDQTKKEMLGFSQSDEFKSLEKKIFAENPGTIQATTQFTDFIQFFHKMAGHPIREPRPMKGDFKF
ncbi:hypothetical protein HGB07_06125 [Candidatus Roizmanbacteria bacterium]|nr:hypothetical protein [Candidatus Roizmanbacteria bacterium]